MQRIGDEAAFLSAGGYHHHLGLNTWESRGGSPPPPEHDRPLPRRDPLPGPARSSANALKRLVEANWPIDGATDHGVSEAIYLRDPDGNGIELYRDRPERRMAARRATARAWRCSTRRSTCRRC